MAETLTVMNDNVHVSQQSSEFFVELDVESQVSFMTWNKRGLPIHNLCK